MRLAEMMASGENGQRSGNGSGYQYESESGCRRREDRMEPIQVQLSISNQQIMIESDVEEDL